MQYYIFSTGVHHERLGVQLKEARRVFTSLAERTCEATEVRKKQFTLKNLTLGIYAIYAIVHVTCAKPKPNAERFFGSIH